MVDQPIEGDKMKYIEFFTLLAYLFIFPSCQPVHVETQSRSDTHPLSRTFLLGEDTWVEVKVNSSGEESVVSFDKGTPDSFVHINEYPYDIFKWRIKIGKNGSLETKKFVATLVYKQTTKKIEIFLSSQTSNALSETIRVLVHIVH